MSEYQRPPVLQRNQGLTEILVAMCISVLVTALMVWIVMLDPALEVPTGCRHAVCPPEREMLNLSGECYCMEKARKP